MDKLRDYLRVKDAAHILGVSPNTLRNWSRNGKIATHRNPVNGYRLFRRADLETLLRKTHASATRARAAEHS
jgi:excisionase family DNA binding protein